MNISITLDEEQTDALESLRLAYDETLTAEEYLLTVLMGVINSEVNRKFEVAAAGLVADAKSLPYQTRLGLIAQVRAAVTPE